MRRRLSPTRIVASVCAHGQSLVCTNGQNRCHAASIVSVFAHARASRVHKRTGSRLNRHLRVRICTRPYCPCANTDSFELILLITCPFLHTSRGRVCRNGHVSAGNGRFVSVFAHAVDRCVQKQTRSVPHDRPDDRACTNGHVLPLLAAHVHACAHCRSSRVLLCGSMLESLSGDMRSKEAFGRWKRRDGRHTFD